MDKNERRRMVINKIIIMNITNLASRLFDRVSARSIAFKILFAFIMSL